MVSLAIMKISVFWDVMTWRNVNMNRRLIGYISWYNFITYSVNVTDVGIHCLHLPGRYETCQNVQYLL